MNRMIRSRLSLLAVLLLFPMGALGCTDCEECWNECYAFCTSPCGDDLPGNGCDSERHLFSVFCLVFLCQQRLCHSSCCEEYPDDPTLCVDLSQSQTEAFGSCEEVPEVGECA